MEAIHINGATQLHPYACHGISVTPNPPRVGEVTTLALALKHSGPEPMTIDRIEFKLAGFGMGVRWEELPPVEQIHLPADPEHVEEVSVEWTPTTSGHRCVQATIYATPLPQPLRIRRNLHVIESAEASSTWHVPFRLGNPEDERMPVVVEVGGNATDSIMTRLVVNRRLVQAGQPVWLDAREEVEAMLILHARTREAIEAVRTVEARIMGRLIDGIQVEVRRPAYAPVQTFTAQEFDRVVRESSASREFVVTS
jgi:hypothetical protein